MSGWNSAKQEMVRWPAVPDPEHPGWLRIDCGCCRGLLWGGETPRECPRCYGGMVSLHVKSRVLALYPGGPFVGHETPEDVARAVAQAAEVAAHV